eukprot:SAG11_NODE_1611_length_4583_cov_3.380687_1_plen_62_part_00
MARTSRELEWSAMKVGAMQKDALPIGMNFIAAFVGVGGFLLGYDVGAFGEASFACNALTRV